MELELDEIETVLTRAEMLHSAQDVVRVEEKLAAEIGKKLRGKNPLVICVMNGGLQFCANLVRRMDFPLQIDYLHASRYRGDTVGGGMRWLKHPELDLKDRHVLIVDDILDEGYTLKEVIEHCQNIGAKEVLCAVLVKKIHDRNVGIEADFVGLEVPDRYVFGCGMDYKSYWRNLPAIYAVAE